MELETLELFAGSRCFTRVAEEMGYRTWSSDILPLDGIDYVTDIFDFDTNNVPFIPKIIWASPDCAAWSRAAGKVHFDGKGIGKPKTEKAEKAFLMLEKTLEIIAFYLKCDPNLKFYIENPVGKLQFVPFMRPNELFSNSIIKRMVTIDQCSYGREHQKPTQIWTNDMEWNPKPRCVGRINGCSHKENIKDVGDKYDRIVNRIKGERRSSLGNLELGGYYERAKLPAALCREVIESCTWQLEQEKYHLLQSN